jgi:hypothetical protein
VVGVTVVGGTLCGGELVIGPDEQAGIVTASNPRATNPPTVIDFLLVAVIHR